MMLMMYRHGLRVSEAVRLRRDDVNLARLASGCSAPRTVSRSSTRSPAMSFARSSATLPPATDRLPWLFLSERGTQLTERAVYYLVRTAGESAGLRDVHPHTLRHSCGYYLADRGTDLRTIQDYLGHRDPRHTVHYTRVAGRRFEGLWK